MYGNQISRNYLSKVVMCFVDMPMGSIVIICEKMLSINKQCSIVSTQMFGDWNLIQGDKINSKFLFFHLRQNVELWSLNSKDKCFVQLYHSASQSLPTGILKGEQKLIERNFWFLRRIFWMCYNFDIENCGCEYMQPEKCINF